MQKVVNVFLLAAALLATIAVLPNASEAMEIPRFGRASVMKVKEIFDVLSNDDMVAVGDTDDDKKISLSEAASYLTKNLGGIKVKPNQLSAGDINADGFISPDELDDVRGLLNIF